jgi:uncharacterized protein (UPF0335 family)
MTEDANARGQLRSFIERIERLEDEKKTISDDIKDVFGEAKAAGFDNKGMKQVLALRKLDEEERQSREHILDTYLAALGMLPDDGRWDGEEDDDAEAA